MRLLNPALGAEEIHVAGTMKSDCVITGLCPL